ncbi:SRPBCC family protein [soil metagenome]
MATTVVIPSDSPTVVMERVFKAPRELVWDTFTKVEHLKNWWGGPGVQNTIELDLRVGGAWNHHMKFPNGMVVSMSWVFREIDRPNKLVWEGSGECGEERESSLLTTTFTDVPGGTKWKLVATFAEARLRDMAVAQGFSRPIEASNEALDQYLSSLL